MSPGFDIAAPPALEAIKLEAVDTFLIAIGVVALPAVAASLARVPEMGWHPLMALHLGIAATVVVSALFRHRMSRVLKARLLVLLFLLLGIGGVLTLGLVGNGPMLLLVSVFIATTAIDNRAGTGVGAVSALVLLAAGVATHRGLLVPAADPSEYVVAAGSWATTLAAYVLLALVAVNVLGRLNTRLGDTAASLDAERGALERSNAELAATNAELAAAIAARQEAETELEQLQAILPICSCCKAIRDGDGNWLAPESYFRREKAIEFSHSYCPACAEAALADDHDC